MLLLLALKQKQKKLLNSLVINIMWNSTDPKDFFPFYAFIMNNKSLSYNFLCDVHVT